MSDNTKFHLIANNLAIDFINTQLLEKGAVNELFNNMQDVSDWAHASGLQFDYKNNNALISKVLALREAIYTLFLSKLDNHQYPPQALTVLNSHLLNWTNQQQLADHSGTLQLQPLTNVLTVEGLLGVIAHEAALLLESNQLDLVRRCSNPDCKLLFLDVSRSKKRKWCSMEICGNRAKAANHYLNTKHL
jgi:predicted RNA-binding Zn ribbon-like protein